MFDWKPEVKSQNQPFSLYFNSDFPPDKGFEEMQPIITKYAPHIQFKKKTESSFIGWMWVLFIFDFIWTVGSGVVTYFLYSRNRKGWGCLGLWSFISGILAIIGALGRDPTYIFDGFHRGFLSIAYCRVILFFEN